MRASKPRPFTDRNRREVERLLDTAVRLFRITDAELTLALEVGANRLEGSGTFSGEQARKVIEAIREAAL